MFYHSPTTHLNSEVKDLEARVDNNISTALKYACKSWFSHLVEVRGDVIAIVSVLRGFLEKRFLAWLECSASSGLRGMLSLHWKN
jgi:hypothetical protein